jgi:methylenetetrahydrofolate reductase (NADPH)
LDAYGIGLTGTNEANRKKWGEPVTVQDIANIFVRYLNQEIESLPWSEAPLTSEADAIKDNLIALNKRGLLTINSQPAVDGVKSSHPVHGWGPSNGYVYQKAYLELLVPASIFTEMVKRIQDQPALTYYAVTREGELRTNAPSDGPNAVTWGVFPGKEIVQPTIVEAVSFIAWKDEAFELGCQWANLYPEGSASRALISQVMDESYLVNIVANDFKDGQTIFEPFLLDQPANGN